MQRIHEAYLQINLMIKTFRGTNEIYKICVNIAKALFKGFMIEILIA